MPAEYHLDSYYTRALPAIRTPSPAFPDASSELVPAPLRKAASPHPQKCSNASRLPPLNDIGQAKPRANPARLPPLDSIGQARPRGGSQLQPLDTIGQSRPRARPDIRALDTTGRARPEVYTQCKRLVHSTGSAPAATRSGQGQEAPQQRQTMPAKSGWGFQQPRAHVRSPSYEPRVAPVFSGAPRRYSEEEMSPKHVVRPFFDAADLKFFQAGPYGQPSPSPSDKDLPPFPSDKDLPPSPSEKDLPPTPETSESPVTPNDLSPLFPHGMPYRPRSPAPRSTLPPTPRLRIPPSRFGGPVVEVVPERKARNSVGEYMSMEQLENMWQSQDMFCLGGTFDVPHKATSPDLAMHPAFRINFRSETAI